MAKLTPYVLALNVGSSSIRFSAFQTGHPPMRGLHGKIGRIGAPGTVLTMEDFARNRQENRIIGDLDHASAASFLINWLGQQVDLASFAAVGHRVVNGGTVYRKPIRITPAILDDLRRISVFAPEHLPGEIALIDLIRERVPHLPQIACFDTTFHRNMPRVAKIISLPRRFEATGIERFGFHGLSYAFLMHQMTRLGGAQAARGRLIFAHLGNGSSLAAVRDGTCIDTTMGFSPAGGVPMSTRSGDLDPELIWYLARTEQMTADGFHRLVNHESGLLGVSQTSSDLQELLDREPHDIRAAEAVAFYCYHIKKRIGSYAAALGGLDTLVFTGGAGENAPVIRARICEGLDFLGIALDSANNATSEPMISAAASRVAVRVIHTDEEWMIAEATISLMGTTT